LLEKNLDEVLFKIIKATDENDLKNGVELDQSSKEKIKESLKKVVAKGKRRGQKRGFG